jgi:hypothetical protein
MTEDRTPASIVTTEAGRTALRVFFRIAMAWDLAESDQSKLLGVGKVQVAAWRAGEVCSPLPKHVALRLSYILGIYAALHTLLPIADHADAWIKKPNSSPLFDGGSALQRMLSGAIDDLRLVRAYLDAQVHS